MHSYKKYIFFTKKEIIIIIFLIVSLLIGSGINLYRHIWSDKDNHSYYESGLKAYEKEINTIIEREMVEKIASSKVTNKKRGKTFCIDINNATKKEFEQLPYIGPVLAKRIIDYRKQVGRFKTLEELINVKGIGNKTFNKFRPYIKIVN